MSVIDKLITDRTQADVDTLTELLGKPFAQWTAEEAAWFRKASSKGAYNYTDLNRVTEAMDYLNDLFLKYGYSTGYVKIIVGHAVPELPNGYTELEYIESSGTQYINTGIKINSSDSVEMDIEITSKPSEQIFIFGSTTTGDGERYGVTYIPNRNYWRNVLGPNMYNFPTSLGAVGKRTIVKDGGKCTIDGVIGDVNSVEFTSSGDFTLFCQNRDNGEFRLFASMRLYLCRIYRNGSLIRSFIPCKNPENVVGLYDKVSSQFFANAGSGVFVAGPEVSNLSSTSETKDPYRWYEDDVPTGSEMAQYIANVDALRNAIAMFDTTPETPKNADLLNYIKANNIEKILVDINQLLINMAAAWFYSGEVYSGEVDA